jgi:hypothetical protein
VTSYHVCFRKLSVFSQFADSGGALPSNRNDRGEISRNGLENAITRQVSQG